VLLCSLALQAAVSQTGSGAAAPTPAAPAAAAAEAALPVYETGLASWYGDPFHGRLTASGEVFDKLALTAAHKTLPFGTLVVVRNLETGQTVTVRINDRGPFVAGRIIDLSQAAGERIGLASRGVARVSLHIRQVSPLLTNPPPKRIQLGSYGVAANAQAAASLAAAVGLTAVFEVAGTVTRVVVYVPAAELAATLAALRRAGFSQPQVSDAPAAP
jgi:rare lipoprotein A